jgi:hypothetical protein
MRGSGESSGNGTTGNAKSRRRRWPNARCASGRASVPALARGLPDCS